MAFQMMTRVFEVSKEKFDLIQSGGDYYINFTEWEIHTPEEVTALVEEARAEFTEDLGYDDLDIRQELGLIHIEECAEIFLVYECYGVVSRDGYYHCLFAGTY